MSATSLRRDLHSAVQVNCTVYGNPIPTVGWVKMAKSLPTDFTLMTDELKGQIIPIVQSHFVVNVTSTGSYGRYSCQASNTVGTAERSFELKPIELPQVKLDPKIAPLVTTGGNISIVCQATGLPLPYVQWSRDGREIPIIESSSIHTMKSSSKNEIHLTNVSRSDAGWYTCSATTGPYIASQKTEIIVIG
jgi:hemicentin